MDEAIASDFFLKDLKLDSLDSDFFEDDVDSETSNCNVSEAEALLFGTDFDEFFQDDPLDYDTSQCIGDSYYDTDSIFVCEEKLPPTDTASPKCGGGASIAPRSTRFCETSPKMLAKYSKGFVPENTAKNTNWAINNFKDWMDWRNGREGVEHVPLDLLENGTAADLNHFLSLYVVETRNKKGTSI